MYVKQLSKYIDVKIYGKCGEVIPCGSKWDPMPDCAKQLMADTYRYVIAFENCLCEDYVTEKLKNLIHHPLPIIPVVMGGVNYSSIMPPNTYIDVKDFNSPEELAVYLSQLADDHDVYNEFVRRKLSIDIEKQSLKDYLCRLCQHADTHRNVTEVAPDAAEFGSVERRCVKPQIYLPHAFKA